MLPNLEITGPRNEARIPTIVFVCMNRHHNTMDSIHKTFESAKKVSDSYQMWVKEGRLGNNPITIIPIALEE